ncbi:hypothetical protein SODALDRAFT_130863 [Sodiomyces alkalinus F11]|uniref:Uncharacterized protein n=1 Tax=Sodiomyces alkalinus (strain CBS 110278 / VKM F-3762 / F11) TaxID=1314773 RepID=A0A3N2PY91_SODAK|nr:hypothetical protein SODALDRAFT_130863 [Sodiomyces alkalinus F11]ROT39480.1 hypothetical protein SODALDRAFT_130863 [Sodiomyces alkalinus F11]
MQLDLSDNTPSLLSAFLFLSFPCPSGLWSSIPLPDRPRRLPFTLPWTKYRHVRIYCIASWPAMAEVAEQEPQKGGGVVVNPVFLFLFSPSPLSISSIPTFPPPPNVSFALLTGQALQHGQGVKVSTLHPKVQVKSVHCLNCPPLAPGSALFGRPTPISGPQLSLHLFSLHHCLPSSVFPSH